jgi:hypothetical protein
MWISNYWFIRVQISVSNKGKTVSFNLLLHTGKTKLKTETEKPYDIIP